MPVDAPSAPVAGSSQGGGKVDSSMSDKGSDLLPFGLGATMALLAMSSLKSRAKVSLAPAPAEKPSIEQQEVYVSIWKTVKDTQMHFNEMSVKACQFGLTLRYPGQDQPAPQIRALLSLMRVAPVHHDIDPVEPAFEEVPIGLELERVRHDTRGIREHAILGDDGITFDATGHGHNFRPG
jgi:hypothetical protein